MIIRTLLKADRIFNLNAVLLQRISGSRFGYYWVIVFLSFALAITGWSLFAVTVVEVEDQLFQNLALLIMTTLLLNLLTYEMKYRHHMMILLPQIRIFPLKSSEILVSMFKLYFKDVRMISYFIFIITVLVGLMHFHYSPAITISFVLFCLVYFMLFEFVFGIFFLFRHMFFHRFDRSISMMIPLIGVITSVLISKNMSLKVPILNLPMVFLAGLLSNDVEMATIHAIVLSGLLLLSIGGGLSLSKRILS